MNVKFEDVAHQGNPQISPRVTWRSVRDLGYVLIGSIEETASGIVGLEVTPTFLPKAHPLASQWCSLNAVFVESIGIGESMYYGPGAD